MPSLKTKQQYLDEQLALYNSELAKARAEYKDNPEKLAAAEAGIQRDIESAKEFWSDPTGMGQYKAGLNVPLFYTNPQGQKVYYEPDPAKRRPETIWDQVPLPPGAMPNSATTPTPQIQNPLTPATTPQVQTPSIVQPPANKTPVVNTSNLTQAYQNQNQAVSNPAIQLPQQFQQNFNATPSITPPGSPQAIKMPNFNRNAGFSTNWSDLFSVAHNRYTR